MDVQGGHTYGPRNAMASSLPGAGPGDVKGTAVLGTQVPWPHRKEDAWLNSQGLTSSETSANLDAGTGLPSHLPRSLEPSFRVDGPLRSLSGPKAQGSVVPAPHTHTHQQHHSEEVLPSVQGALIWGASL